ncbi:flagellar protein FlaG [Pseudogracilibacillus sp. ICA-222130]|uniref:flagellar protein FlaG n=1 Tax=Pseudogracilibacillus sp. ICA-222130 TaxID=3134655 RepID=UPI0030BAB9AF
MNISDKISQPMTMSQNPSSLEDATNRLLQTKLIKEVHKNVKKEDVQDAVERMNHFIDPFQTNLKFVFHEELNEYYVTVVNPVTEEIIREIPPKKMLDMYAAMTEFVGIVVDEQV